jgi:hypothetical protein
VSSPATFICVVPGLYLFSGISFNQGTINNPTSTSGSLQFVKTIDDYVLTGSVSLVEGDTLQFSWSTDVVGIQIWN